MSSSKNKEIKILLVDDHEVLMESLKYILENEYGIKVVGMVEDGINIIDMCERMQPDIILMDIEMPTLNGVMATKMIKERYEAIKVIIHTTFDNKESVIDSFAVGADGYILKSIDYEHMIEAIKCVESGLIVIDGRVKQIIKTMNNH